MPADCGVTVTHVHALTPVAEIPAACETAGTAAHYVCGVCGKLCPFGAIGRKGETK